MAKFIFRIGHGQFLNNMLIESSWICLTFFAVTILEIFAIEMRIATNLTFIMGQVGHKYANRKLTCDFVLEDIINVYPLYQHFEDICCRDIFCRDRNDIHLEL